MKIFNFLKGPVETRTTNCHGHEGDCGYSDCFWHGPESLADAFKVCFECDHVYRAEKDLRRTYRQGAPTVMTWIRAVFIDTDKIYFCPLCLHDF